MVDTKKMNLHQKLIEVRKQAPYIKKDAAGFNFEYVSGSLLLGLLRPKMDELGILLNYDIIEMESEEVTRQVFNKKLNKMMSVETARVKMKYIFTFTNAEDPGQTVEKTLWFQGIGDDIQDIGGYNTYALRYFLLGFFNIPNDKEDPDAYESKKEKSQPVECITADQLEMIETLINGYSDIRQRMIKHYKSLTKIPINDYDTVISSINKLIEDKEVKK